MSCSELWLDEGQRGMALHGQKDDVRFHRTKLEMTELAEALKEELSNSRLTALHLAVLSAGKI